MSIEKRTGVSTARLRAVGEVLNQKYVAEARLPGFLVEVWRRGERVLRAKAGVSDVEAALPVREDAIFRIYSMTKPVVGVALLALLEDGRIGLGDEVADYLPAFGDLEVITGGEPGAWTTGPATRRMQVIDLARHTAGFGTNWSALGQLYGAQKLRDPFRAGGLPAMAEALARLPLVYSPGTRWAYSDAGLNLLGHVLELASGQSLGALLKERIFSPLGMTDTGFFCPPAQLSRLVPLYRLGPNGRALDPETAWGASPPSLESAGSGLVSTAADYSRFCQMLLGRGALEGVRVLAPRTVDMLRTNYLPGNADIATLGGGDFAGWRGEGYGYSICTGTTIDQSRRLIPGNAGDIFWSGGGMTTFFVDPAEDLSVVFMASCLDFQLFFDVQGTLRTLVYTALVD